MSNPGSDVAVVGDGVVGLVCALLCARPGLEVALIAPHFGTQPPAGAIGLRCYAITPGTRAVLEAAGAWDAIDHARCGSFDAMEVWDARSSGRIRFPPPPRAPVPMGHIVEHDNLAAALTQRVHESARIEVHAASFAALGPLAPRRLVLDDAAVLEAALVVAADGVHSGVRAALGIDVRRRDYGQSATVCNVATERPHGRVARQRFLPTGPLAFLPLADPHASSIVWSADAALDAELSTDSDAAFRLRLEEAFEGALGAVTGVSERARFPLARQRALRLVDEGAALVGDAAHVVHPLAGQGLNLGILDAASLAECLADAPRRDGAAWPPRRTLERYARWRTSEALAMTAVTDSLQRLFAREELPVRWLRGLGMRLTDRLAPVKRGLIERAMGIEGDLPKLARDGAR